MPQPFKEAVVCPLLKRPPADSTLIDNFHHVSDPPFLVKVVEEGAVLQLQRFLNIYGLSRLFPVRLQTGIWDGNGRRATFGWSLGGVCPSSLHLTSWGLSMPSAMVTFWGGFRDGKWGALCCPASLPFSVVTLGRP